MLKSFPSTQFFGVWVLKLRFFKKGDLFLFLTKKGFLATFQVRTFFSKEFSKQEIFCNKAQTDATLGYSDPFYVFSVWIRGQHFCETIDLIFVSSLTIDELGRIR